MVNKPVLHIENLQIPRGKLVFVVGKSGVGKSTLIETLGLMNSTIAQSENCSLQYYPEQDNSTLQLKGFWSQSNEVMSTFRRKNFSFIFQSTNLMQNFTAGENMMINLLIEGWSTKDARERIVSVMKELSLSEDLFDRNISELSGGQRQRLAFVRGITAPFQVLFGDEPTGNLDEKTAVEVMNSLKMLVYDQRKAAIIVSHDLQLALRFADMIIALTPKNMPDGTYIGQAEEDNILYRKEYGWTNMAGLAQDDPETILKNHLN